MTYVEHIKNKTDGKNAAMHLFTNEESPLSLMLAEAEFTSLFIHLYIKNTSTVYYLAMSFLGYISSLLKTIVGHVMSFFVSTLRNFLGKFNVGDKVHVYWLDHGVLDTDKAEAWNGVIQEVLPNDVYILRFKKSPLFKGRKTYKKEVWHETAIRRGHLKKI
ncbi:predicted protein [Chaetoceros tenuissimus]|uniref:Uncharacterized protein n=1 Tax=Chaetoceros tenuissimus TaxID=426638 RepID=A0AAD3HCS6_9STRA|nr:predicted protein [Chaetoceros tenuissimus]